MNNPCMAYVVITKDSFEQEYDIFSRTYVFGGNEKAFLVNMGRYSIYASCLDGRDPAVRLERYMAAERGGPDGWKIEYAYLVKHD